MARKQTSQRHSKQPIGITTVEYGRLQVGYEHFNKTLFEGELPDVFITYQRKAHSRGYFSPDRFSGRVGTLGQHELALNPDSFVDRTDELIASTLVHEMVHVWQHALGKPSARGYHNKEWAAKMKLLGLQPSNTGHVGGKETGQQMTHYIIPDGPFTQSYDKLAAAGWILNLQSAPRPGGAKAPSSKVKSTCPTCGGNAWGRPNYRLACVACGNVPMALEIQSYDVAAE
jgi:SprT-like family